MSGWLTGLGAAQSDWLATAAKGLAFSPESWIQTGIDPPWYYATSRVDARQLWEPAHDLKSTYTVAIAGRIALEPEQWKTAASLPFEGGLACRHILDGLLGGGETFIDSLNGAFALLVWNGAKRELGVWTDRMGFVPVYSAHRPEGVILCTHPDVLAKANPNGLAYDLTTMAEMLSHWHGAHPYTYYRGVSQLDPGSHYRWKEEASSIRRYWSPRYAADPSVDAQALGEELAAGIRKSVRLRTQEAVGPAGLFLSGGADSRAVLYGADNPSKLTCFTFYDEENQELATARELAKRAGSIHVGLRRDSEHYGRGASEAIRVMGGMWNLCDAHYTEFLPRLRTYGIESWLSGCFADYLFKGIAQDRRNKTLFGRTMPFFEPAPFSHEWYFNHAAVAKKWSTLVEERCTEMYAGCDVSGTSDEARWNVEMHRLWPISREATIGSRLLLMRTMPWDVVLADRAVIDVLMRIPSHLKLNSEVWNIAVARICRGVRDVRNANFGVTIGSSRRINAAEFLVSVGRRKIARLLGRDRFSAFALATAGSWPNFRYYMLHSPLLAALWNGTPREHRELLSDLLGFDPWSLTLHDWADRDVNQWYRLMTLRIWLAQR